MNNEPLNKSQWNQRLKPYALPNRRKSTLQIINSVLPYLAIWVIDGVLLTSALPLWVKIFGACALSVFGGLFMVRIFILFHDCTHLSFFHSKRACSFWGHIFGVLTFTPYKTWQHEHNMHHGSVGDLDRRGMGDVWTLTVDEYASRSKFGRLVYRLYRNPIVLFVIAPVVLFAILNRFPARKKTSREEWVSSTITNLGLLATFLMTWAVFGWQMYFAIQLPILFVAATAGVWLFFVQHQFEDVYWAHHEQWDIVKAALEGSTYFKLPIVLEWFTGHIGYHHVHHLNARIPNYNLKKCFGEVEGLEPMNTIQFFGSFKLALLELYDEVNGKMIGFGELRRRRKGSIV